MFYLAKTFWGWIFTFIVGESISGALFPLVYYVMHLSSGYYRRKECSGNFGETNASTNLTTVVGSFTNAA